MLSWGNRFNICAFLDNHQYQLPGNEQECLAGFGAVKELNCSAEELHKLSSLQRLQQFLDDTDDWRFGHLSYDLKNEIEQLQSGHTDKTGFPSVYFFVPQYVLQLNQRELRIGSFKNDQELLFREILSAAKQEDEHTRVQVKERMSREEYISTIHKVQQHILRGDCYELNYCMEFYAEEAVINPVQVYQSLTAVSPNPFSAFYKVNNSYLLCASPERFLRKKGSRLLSQPIKGTLRRNKSNKADDEQLKQQLYTSAKDRSENVMVVDLVRNDLSRVCREGTVEVDELFGIYSFPQVHQMISSVSGEVKEDVSFAEILHSTFPMGSMTGAPKRKVMELIDLYERNARGLFSGAVGYFSPDGDFDFNVVIRSILYNAAAQYLSYSVGSGITWYSVAENEYDECLLKAAAIRKVLQ